MIETLGWVRVTLPGRRLNDRMFIAAVEGHSMDDGKSGLVDGGYAVFELWPSGTKQNLSVLVRGSFSDPETGNYAVKKYVADERDEYGRHNAISLVSLNPNKERYPNIELQPEDDDDITVVAKVVKALSTDESAKVTAAIANAVFDLLGVRVRKLPITRDAVVIRFTLQGRTFEFTVSSIGGPLAPTSIDGHAVAAAGAAGLARQQMRHPRL